ncbi:MAG: histidine kinase dimerization/phosphoacceptor domain -containing protein [Bacteroidales bacterium]|nr:histidine kinase dimerization/phosphoacceptor domain -containing protein [Bacteroidales bacterium]
MRYRFILLFFFFFCFSTSSFSQFNTFNCIQYDSLIVALPSADQTQQAKILIILSRQTADSFPLQSFTFIINAYKLALQLNNLSLKGETRILFGEYYQKKRNFFYALNNFQAALKIYHQINNFGKELEVLAMIGNLECSLRNYSQAITYFNKGLVLSRSQKNRKMMEIFLDKLAIIYQAKGDILQANKYYQEAIIVCQQAGDKHTELIVLNDIGSILIDQKQYDLALKNYQNILTKADSLDGEFIGAIYTRIAHIYFQKSDFKHSLAYNMKALRVRTKSNIIPDITSSFINIAGDYFSLDHPDSAQYFLQKGLKLARRYDRKNLVENAYRHLFNYYLKKRRYSKALESYKQYTDVSDSMIKEQNQTNILMLEANLKINNIEKSNEFLSKKNNIQTLNLDNQKYQNYFVLGLMVLAGIWMIYYLVWFLYNRHAREKVQDLFNQLSHEQKERELAEDRAREQEYQYRFLAENSIDFITHFNNKMQRVYASPSSKRIYGYEPEVMLTKAPYDLAHPDFYDYVEKKLSVMLANGCADQFTYLTKKKDGSYFWAETIVNPIFDLQTNDFKEIVAVTRDIQERKLKELELMENTKQKENLLKEIHHRVKNNFAILISLINMQMDQSKNPEVRQSLMNLQLRIRTMSLVHEMLYRSKDFEKISFPEYLHSLSSVISGTYNRKDITLSFDTDEVVIDIESCIPLGLIINEILSNAYKHAFPKNRSGNIWVKLKKNIQLKTLSFSICDDGIGLPDQFQLEKCKSMGFQIVQILCKQVEGEMVLKNAPGVLFSLCFPIPSA